MRYHDEYRGSDLRSFPCSRCKALVQFCAHSHEALMDMINDNMPFLCWDCDKELNVSKLRDQKEKEIKKIKEQYEKKILKLIKDNPVKRKVKK